MKTSVMYMYRVASSMYTCKYSDPKLAGTKKHTTWHCTNTLHLKILYGGGGIFLKVLVVRQTLKKIHCTITSVSRGGEEWGRQRVNKGIEMFLLEIQPSWRAHWAALHVEYIEWLVHLHCPRLHAPDDPNTGLSKEHLWGRRVGTLLVWTPKWHLHAWIQHYKYWFNMACRCSIHTCITHGIWIWMEADTCL